MKTLSYLLLAALLLTLIFGFLMVIGEPTPGDIFDSIVGIISMKLCGVCCMATAIFGIHRLFR